MNVGKCIINNNQNAIYGLSTRYNTCSFDYEKNPVSVLASKRPIDSEKDTKNVFGGLFNKALVGMYIKKVIYSNPVTIVFWSDNTKTTSKAQEGDTYNKEMGLALCVLKKIVGGDQVANLMKDWVVEENIVDLKMLREKERASKKKVVEVKEENSTAIPEEKSNSKKKNGKI